MTIAIFILWVIYSIFEGHREAEYWHLSAITAISSGKEHFNWSIQRLIVIIIAIFSANLILLKSIILFLSMMFVFPFLHDGAYYMRRNSLDGSYPKKWFDQSVTSTAILTKVFTPLVRTIAFFIGVIILLYSALAL